MSGWCRTYILETFEGIHPPPPPKKKKLYIYIFSFTHPNDIPNLLDFLSFVKHKMYFEEYLSVALEPIDFHYMEEKKKRLKLLQNICLCVQNKKKESHTGLEQGHHFKCKKRIALF